MKKIVLLCCIAASLAGCQKRAELSQDVGNGFNVETLFTKDGCTVYRFQDDRPVYFTNCNGSTRTRHSCGKGCIRDDYVNGGRPNV